MSINTVAGKCEPRDLGFTLIHEHLAAGMPGFEFDTAGFDRKREMAKLVDQLKEIKTLGVTSFVVPCPMELGRDPEYASQAPDKSELQPLTSPAPHNEPPPLP